MFWKLLRPVRASMTTLLVPVIRAVGPPLTVPVIGWPPRTPVIVKLIGTPRPML